MRDGKSTQVSKGQPLTKTGGARQIRVFKADTIMVVILSDKTKGERGHIFQLWRKANRSPEGSERATWSAQRKMFTDRPSVSCVTC